MRNHFALFGLFMFAFCSCDRASKNEAAPFPGPTIYPVPDSRSKDVQEPDSLSIIRRDEYLMFDSTVVDSAMRLPAMPFAFAMVYKMPTLKGDSGVERIFYSREAEGIKLEPKELSSFFSLINNPASYNQGVAACDDPYVGIILYDSLRHPLQLISICLDCNRVTCRPELLVTEQMDHPLGLSRSSRNKLRHILKNWGIEYQGASELFDSPGDVKKFHKMKEHNPGLR